MSEKATKSAQKAMRYLLFLLMEGSRAEMELNRAPATWHRTLDAPNLCYSGKKKFKKPSGKSPMIRIRFIYLYCLNIVVDNDQSIFGLASPFSHKFVLLNLFPITAGNVPNNP